MGFIRRSARKCGAPPYRNRRHLFSVASSNARMVSDSGKISAKHGTWPPGRDLPCYAGSLTTVYSSSISSSSARTRGVCLIGGENIAALNKCHTSAVAAVWSVLLCFVWSSMRMSISAAVETGGDSQRRRGLSSCSLEVHWGYPRVPRYRGPGLLNAP
jgi:hypothetical protein